MSSVGGRVVPPFVFWDPGLPVTGGRTWSKVTGVRAVGLYQSGGDRVLVP